MTPMDDEVSHSRRGLISGSLAGAGLTAGGVIFGRPTAALADTAGLKVITPTGETGGAVDRAAIQGALKPGGAQALLAPGDFYIDEPIVLYSNQRLIGSGAGATKIHQVGTGHGITSTTAGSLNYVTVAGLTLVGNAASGSSGIYLIPSPTREEPHRFDNLTNITIEDCVTMKWGDCGVHLAAPIASRITRVQSVRNGGDGFYITTAQLGTDSSAIRAATSLVLEACYALDNGKNGFELDTVSYSSLTGCASDRGKRGYALYGCRAVTLTSCGAESFSEAGFLLQSSTSCSLFGAYTFAGGTVGISVTRSTAHQTIGGAIQSKPTSDTRNFIRTEAGTSTVVWGVSRPATTGTSTNTFDGQVTNLDGSA